MSYYNTTRSSPYEYGTSYGNSYGNTYSTDSYSSNASSASYGVSNNYSAYNNYDSSAVGYSSGNAYSSSAGIDSNLLQHENPNNCTDLAPALPLDQYRLNVDNNPHVIRRKAQEKAQYIQEIAVRYLKPPAVPRGGDIIIQQQPSRQIAPAPALVVRQPGRQAPTPPPLIIREAPPQPPQPLPGRTVTIPGKLIPPPARKVIVEKLPSQPAKPQNILIERWLPYGPQSQRVIYRPARPACIIPDPKNVVIEWEAPDVQVERVVRNLGIHHTDPRDYVSRYGSSLIRSDQLPPVAIQYSNNAGVELAANSRGQSGLVLEGDVNALNLINLDRNSLGYLRNRSSGRSFTTYERSSHGSGYASDYY